MAERGWNFVRTSHRCSNCGKEMGADDCCEFVPHRLARRLRGLVFPVSIGWTLALYFVFVVWLLVDFPGWGMDTTVGLMIGLPMVPGFVLFVLSLLFPKERVWTCSECGHIDAPDGFAQAPVPPWLRGDGTSARIDRKAPASLRVEMAAGNVPPPLKLRTGAGPAGVVHHCPACGKELGPGESNEVVPHRLARRIRSLMLPITGVWTVVVFAAMLSAMVVQAPNGGSSGRDVLRIVEMFLCLLPLPWFFLSMLIWFSPKMRRWRCDQCGHVHEVRLAAHAAPDRTMQRGPGADKRGRGRKKSHRKAGYDRKPRGNRQAGK